MGEQPSWNPYGHQDPNEWQSQTPYRGQMPRQPYGQQQRYPDQPPYQRVPAEQFYKRDSAAVGDERQQIPEPHTDGLCATASEAPSARSHPLWPPTILLVLALIGLVAGIWAIVIFPSRAPAAYPKPFKISIVSEVAISHVFISIWSSEQSTYMQVGAAPESRPITPQNEGDINIYIIGNIHVSCPSGVSCSFSHIQGNRTEQWDLAVPITALPNGRLVSHVVTINDPRFGPASNGEAATAQLPTVSTAANLPGPAPEIDLAYKVPDADRYDWSIPPALYVSSNWPDWSEQLSSSVSEIPPVAITGTDDAAQAQDDRDTFISGILLGVAGAAAIALTQEGMHILLGRREKSGAHEDKRRRLSPSR